jgi:hypothetical protein
VAIDVVTEIEISRPRNEVALYAADPDNASRWYERIETVEWKTPPPLQVDSRIAFVARFMGRELAYTYEVREYEPGERLVMSTTSGPFPMETTYTWSDIEGDGTRMTLRNHGGPSNVLRFLDPLMATRVRRATQQDLVRLKRMLEAEGHDRRHDSCR